MKTVPSVIVTLMKMRQNVSGDQKILMREGQDRLGKIGTKKENIKITTMTMTIKKE